MTLPRIAMFGSGKANFAPLAQLLERHGFPITVFDVAKLEADAEWAADVLYLPGGWYRFEDSLNRRIVDYVRQGGGCVGTCAGSYLVAGYIPIIPGRVLRANIRGRVYLEPQQGDHPILDGVVHRCTRHNERKWEQIAVTHLGGPLIFPEDRSNIIASYDTEGEIGAIVAADIGKGRAVALASHPELPLADLPAADTARQHDKARDMQGDESRIVLNAVLWAARQTVIPMEKVVTS